MHVRPLDEAHRRHLLLIEFAVPALVGAVVVVGEGVHGGASVRPGPIAVGVAAAAALLGRRRWPLWTLAVSGALVVVLFQVDRPAASVAVLAPAVALYSVALRRGRPQQVAAGLVAVGAVIAADVVHHGRPGVGQTIAHVLLVAVPLLGAEVIRTHQANVGLLVERLELAEKAREQEAERRAAQERMRIARELHDVVAHTLTEVNVQAAAAAERSGPGEARDALERIEETTHSALGELRAIVGVLRDPDVTQPPLAPAPGLGDVATLVERARAAGLVVRIATEGSPPSPPGEATSLAAYRIVQESLTNARRHAPDAAVTVTIRYDSGGVALTVENGVGDGRDGSGCGTGVGIVGMRERAAAIGGHLDASPTAAGFRVHAELPYEPR